MMLGVKATGFMSLLCAVFADFVDPDSLRTLTDIKVCQRASLRYLVRRFINLEMDSYMHTKARSELECASFCYAKTTMCKAATFDQHSGVCRFSHYPFSCSGPGLLSGPTFLRVGKRTIQCLTCEGDPATPTLSSLTPPPAATTTEIDNHVLTKARSGLFAPSHLVDPQLEPLVTRLPPSAPVQKSPLTEPTKEASVERLEGKTKQSVYLPRTTSGTVVSEAKRTVASKAATGIVKGVKITAHTGLRGENPSVTLWYPSTTTRQTDLHRFLTQIAPGQTLSVMAVTRLGGPIVTPTPTTTTTTTTTPIPTTTTTIATPIPTSTSYFARWLLPFHYRDGSDDEDDETSGNYRPTAYPYEKIKKRVSRLRNHFRKIQLVHDGVAFDVARQNSDVGGSPRNHSDFLDVDVTSDTEEPSLFFPFHLFYKDKNIDSREHRKMAKPEPNDAERSVRFRPSRPELTIVTIESTSEGGGKDRISQFSPELYEEQSVGVSKEPAVVKTNHYSDSDDFSKEKSGATSVSPNKARRVLPPTSAASVPSELVLNESEHESESGVTVIFGRPIESTPRTTTTEPKTLAPPARRQRPKPTPPPWLTGNGGKPKILPGMNSNSTTMGSDVGGPSEELDKYGVSLALQEVMAAVAVGPPFTMSDRPYVVQPYGHCLAGALLPCSYGVMQGCELRQAKNGCWHCVCSYKGSQKGCFGSPYLTRDSWADLLYGRRKCRNGKRAQSVYRYYRKQNKDVDKCIATKHPYCGFSEDTIMHKMPKTLDECQTLCFEDKRIYKIP